MISVFKETPCEQYFTDHISEVLPIAASATDNKTVRNWINAQWTIFRMGYKPHLDAMYDTNFHYTEKYLKEVRFLSSLISYLNYFL